MKTFSKLILLVGLVVSFVAGYGVGYQHIPVPDSVLSYTVENKDAPVSIDFSLFWNVWNKIKQQYVKQPVNEQALFYGAIKGMVESLDDPYSAFLDQEENAMFNEEMSGNFNGIGVEIGMKNDHITVVAPIPGTPAETAGLRAGDWIVSIADADTSNLTITEAVSMIRGEPGTTVSLGIIRDEGAAQTIEIIRTTISVPTVVWKDLDTGIFRMQITMFGDDTEADFKKAIKEIQAQEVKGIVLDLRNNPGGYLQTSVSVASEFVAAGKTIVSERFPSQAETELRSENGAQHLVSVPVVVLVNEGSASAAEILAGALRELREVKLVGTATYGKGTVQELEPLAENTSLRLTVAEWLLPSGSAIPDDGIKPDETVEISDEDFNAGRDPQIQRAIELLANN